MKSQNQVFIIIGFIFFLFVASHLFGKQEQPKIYLEASEDIQVSPQVPHRPVSNHVPEQASEASSKPTESAKVRLREPIPTNLEEVIRRNRRTLDKAPRWMDDDKVYNGALFNYGLPGYARPWINLDVGESPTIADLLGLLLVNMKSNQRISYLEIGVSVGKCVFQMLEILGKDSNVTAMDLEEINPAFEATLQNKEEISDWDLKKSTVKSKGSFRRYNKGTDRPIFNYIASDEYDEGSWEPFTKYGIAPVHGIYSDAMHAADALKLEWKSIKERNLLAIGKDNYWFMVWDDLAPAMKQVAKEIIEDMKLVAQERGEHHVETAFFKINGWLGKNEGPHEVGVVSNLELHKILQAGGLVLEE